MIENEYCPPEAKTNPVVAAWASSDRQTAREDMVPLWKKYALTVTEASHYFGIGEKKLRGLIEQNLGAGFVLQNGVKYLIKRKQFEEFLDKTNSV